MMPLPVQLAQQSLMHRVWFGRGGQLGGPAQSTMGAEIDSIYLFILWVMAISFVVLMAAMLYFVVVYRRRPGVAPPLSRSHNTPLEIAWTVVPTALMVPMFFWGFWSYASQVVAPANYEDITLTAGQWWWRWTYPNGAQSNLTAHVGASNVPVFLAPAGRPVRLRMSSMDVIHSFYVPDFRTKFDVFPNRYTAYWFETPPLRSGETHRDHLVFCAEYCGDNHSEMAAVIRVVSPEEYAKTLEEWATPGTPLELGQRIFETTCAACHSIDGPRKIGPNWRNLYGYERQLSDGSVVVADENYIRESILNPGAKVVAGYENVQMNSFQGLLNADQINGLIVFLQSLSDRGPAPAPTDAPASDAAGQDGSGQS